MRVGLMLQKKIQVDMFEVLLGAAMLLQFQLQGGKVVRVIVDAGVTPKHVALMVGTHYDEDHLTGLVPIVEDPSYSTTPTSRSR